MIIIIEIVTEGAPSTPSSNYDERSLMSLAILNVLFALGAVVLSSSKQEAAHTFDPIAFRALGQSGCKLHYQFRPHSS
jgi:hypothetical protein